MRKTQTDRECSSRPATVQVLKLLYSLEEGLTEQQWVLSAHRMLIGWGVDPLSGVARRDDAQVSARHAQLWVQNGRVQLLDLKSKNGTYVNGVPSPPARETSLADGDVIRIGQSLFLLRSELAVPADATAQDRVLKELIRGSSPVVRALRVAITQLAPGSQSILLLGETGTGKELAAQAIHTLSGRRGPLITVNCAAIGVSLAESMLFGHVPDAFTGAKKHAGWFREADNGSLFLDELGDLPLELQPKLLRAVETGRFWPVGGAREEQVNIRFIAATNRDLYANGQSFRTDLRARLGRAVIELPTLAERREDLLPLLYHYLGSPNWRFKANACELLLLHAWQENVRELVNVAGNLQSRFGKKQELITREDIEEILTHGRRTRAAPGQLEAPAAQSEARPPKRARQQLVLTKAELKRVMKKFRDNQTHAAAELGISRRTLSRLLHEL